MFLSLMLPLTCSLPIATSPATGLSRVITGAVLSTTTVRDAVPLAPALPVAVSEMASLPSLNAGLPLASSAKVSQLNENLPAPDLPICTPLMVQTTSTSVTPSSGVTLPSITTTPLFSVSAFGLLIVMAIDLTVAPPL